MPRTNFESSFALCYCVYSIKHTLQTMGGVKKNWEVAQALHSRGKICRWCSKCARFVVNLAHFKWGQHNFSCAVFIRRCAKVSSHGWLDIFERTGGHRIKRTTQVMHRSYWRNAAKPRTWLGDADVSFTGQCTSVLSISATALCLSQMQTWRHLTRRVELVSILGSSRQPGLMIRQITHSFISTQERR